MEVALLLDLELSFGGKYLSEQCHFHGPLQSESGLWAMLLTCMHIYFISTADSWRQAFCTNSAFIRLGNDIHYPTTSSTHCKLRTYIALCFMQLCFYNNQCYTHYSNLALEQYKVMTDLHMSTVSMKSTADCQIQDTLHVLTCTRMDNIL